MLVLLCSRAHIGFIVYTMKCAPFVLYCMIPGTGEGKLLYILYTSINCIGGVMCSLVPRLSPCWENLGTRLGDLYCMMPRNR